MASLASVRQGGGESTKETPYFVIFLYQRIIVPQAGWILSLPALLADESGRGESLTPAPDQGTAGLCIHASYFF